MPKAKTTTDTAPETVTVTLTDEAAEKIKADLDNSIGTIVVADTPEHTATGPGASVVDEGNGGRCW